MPRRAKAAASPAEEAAPAATTSTSTPAAAEETPAKRRRTSSRTASATASAASKEASPAKEKPAGAKGKKEKSDGKAAGAAAESPAKKPRASAGKKRKQEPDEQREADDVDEKEDGVEATEKEEKPRNKGKKKKADAENEEEQGPISPSAPTAAFAQEHGDNTTAEGLSRSTLSTAQDVADAITSYTKRPEGQVRIVSWNITSYKSCEKKGLFKYLEVEDPDIVVLTETKVNDDAIPTMHPGFAKYPNRTWGIDSTAKGYAGITMWSKIQPKSTTVGIPSAGKKYHGRVLTLEFDKAFVVGTYATNAGEGLAKMEDKKAWHAAFHTYLRTLDAQKPVIWCGDLNVVGDQRDLSAAKKKWNKQPGYTTIETEAHRAFLDGKVVGGEEGGGAKFVDAWRELHPDAIGHFTFYSFRGACRGKGIGWRLDSFILSERLYRSSPSFVAQCEIRHEMYGPSDHIPVICDVQGPL